jgi:hypothetical protein
VLEVAEVVEGVAFDRERLRVLAVLQDVQDLVGVVHRFPLVTKMKGRVEVIHFRAKIYGMWVEVMKHFHANFTY